MKCKVFITFTTRFENNSFLFVSLRFILAARGNVKDTNGINFYLWNRASLS